MSMVETEQVMVVPTSLFHECGQHPVSGKALAAGIAPCKTGGWCLAAHESNIENTQKWSYKNVDG